VALVDDSAIPPALKPLLDPRKGYLRRKAAIEACWAWYESAIMPVHWQALAAQT